MKTLLLSLALLLPQVGLCDAAADALAVCRYLYRDTDTKGGSRYSRHRERAITAGQRSAFVAVSITESFIYSIENDAFEKTTLTAEEFSTRERLTPGDDGGRAFLVLRMTDVTPQKVESDLGLSFCHGAYLVFTRNEETGDLRFYRRVTKCCF